MENNIRHTAWVIATVVAVVGVSIGLAYRLGESQGRPVNPTTSSTASTTYSARPFLQEATGITLTIMVGSVQADELTNVITIDIDRGTMRETVISGGPLRVRGGPARRANDVVVVHDRSSARSTGTDLEALVYPSTFDSAPRVLGRGSGVVTSVAPDRVWLLEADGAASGGGGMVREIDLRGAVVTPPQRYPADHQPVAAVEGGLLRQVRTARVYGDTFELWDPSSDKITGEFATEPAFLVDARGKWVAWLADSGLHVTDVTTGADRIVQRPSDRLAFTSGGRFSPDGRVLATKMVDASSVGSAQPALTRFGTDEIHPETWGLVDLATGKTTSIPGSRTENGSAIGPTWSPDSRWFMFSHHVTDPGGFGPEFGSESLVLAYRLGAVRARALELVLPRRPYGPLVPAF